MPRPRTKQRHLPACVYLNHGQYYYVKHNRWTPLGRTLPDALRAYAALLEAPSEPTTTISDLLDAVLARAAERQRAANTLAQYTIVISQLKPILVEFRPQDLKPKDVAQLLDHHRSTPNYANRMRSVLKAAFDIAVRRGLVDANPVTPVDRFEEQRRTRYLTDAEYNAIWQAGSPTLRAIMDVAYGTAQRIGDVLAIRHEQLTDTGIDFTQQKTNAKLTVAWTPALRAAIESTGKTQGYIFALPNGAQRKYRGVNDLLNRAAKKAGVEDVRLHDLRAKSLTDAKRAGLNAQLLAGHTTETQTARYIRNKERLLVRGPGTTPVPSAPTDDAVLGKGPSS